jgi:hypothetical protein
VNVAPPLGALIGAVVAMAAIAPLAYRRWPRGTCYAAVVVSAA